MSSHRSSEFELFKNAKIPSDTNSLKRREASDIQSRITVESIQDLILEKGQPITVTQIVTELLPSATRKEREKIIELVRSRTDTFQCTKEQRKIGAGMSNVLVVDIQKDT